MLLTCCSHIAHMLLTCCSHVAHTLLTCHSLFARILLTCCSHVAHMLFKCILLTRFRHISHCFYNFFAFGSGSSTSKIIFMSDGYSSDDTLPYLFLLLPKFPTWDRHRSGPQSRHCSLGSNCPHGSSPFTKLPNVPWVCRDDASFSPLGHILKGSNPFGFVCKLEGKYNREPYTQPTQLTVTEKHFFIWR